MSYYAKRFFGQQGIVTDGLKLWLDASNPESYHGSGTTWFDLSGNGNNGSMLNGVLFNSTNGGVMILDGIDDKINCGTNFTITNQLTMSIWVYNEWGNSAWARIIGVENAWIGMNDGRTSQSLGFFGSSIDANFPSTPIFLNMWSNITYKYAGDGIELWVNGVYYSKIAKTGNLNPIGTTPLTIGGRMSDNARQLKGKISSALIYNRALTSTEILNNYNATKSKYGL